MTLRELAVAGHLAISTSWPTLAEEIASRDLRNPSTARSKSVTKILSGSFISCSIRKLISMFDGERSVE